MHLQVEFSKNIEHWEDLLTTGFEKESDRACVILAATLLDSALETLLREKLVPLATGNDPLLENINSPISDFNSRIELSYRIGLISSKFARDLHLIRKIRNSFAHNITGCTFDDSNVRSRISELTRSNGIFKRTPAWREHFPDGPKGEFMVAVSWMQWHLRLLAENIESFEEAKVEFGYSLEQKPSDEIKSIESAD